MRKLLVCACLFLFLGGICACAKRAPFEVAEVSDSVRIMSTSENAGELRIPEKIDGLPVTEIGEGAFAHKKFEKIVLPDTVKVIHKEAFAFCESLQEIQLSSALEEVGRSAFYWCDHLKALSLPASIREIGEGAFTYCDALERIDVEEGSPAYSSRGGALFSKDQTSLLFIPLSLPVLEIPSSVEVFAQDVFKDRIALEEIRAVDCPIADALDGVLYNKAHTQIFAVARRRTAAVHIAEGIEEIPAECFHDCTMSEVYFPSTLRVLGHGAFLGCSHIEKIGIAENPVFYAQGNCLIERETGSVRLGCAASQIPLGVKKIGATAFSYCRTLKEIALPAGLTMIDEDAFSGCLGLTEIAIPSTVEEIAPYAFFGCRKLERAVFEDAEGWVSDKGAANFTDPERAAKALLIENIRYFKQS